MRRRTDKKRSKLKATVAIVFIFIVAAVVIFLISEEKICGLDTVCDDDQRSTLWPVLVSLIATMLGSLITSYVFLKEALDRTSDEKIYYGEVIREYREKTMRSLWIYMLISLALMGIVICLYSMFYFMEIRSRDEVRITLIVSYGLCMAGSAWFLNKCIDIDRGLHKTADKLLRAQMADAREKLCILKQNREKQILESSVDESFDELVDRMTDGAESLAVWLQIADGWAKDKIDKKKFINRFSEWEKVLFCLVESGEGFLGKQSMYEKVRFAVEHGEAVYGETDVEQKDAEAHKWGRNFPYAEVSGVKRSLKIDGERFCAVYELLSEIRNLLQVQLETSRTKETAPLKEREQEVATLFSFFLMQLSLYIFCMLPKLKIFFPSGKFSYTDFYGIRFESSSFRTSLFERSLFVRNQMKDCNFGMASFQKTDFYYTKSEDCSFTNTYFKDCFFQNASFKDVDFTGAVLENCDLRSAQFEEAILSNINCEGTALGENTFSFSRLTDVIIELRKDAEKTISECGFKSATLERIRLNLSLQESCDSVQRMIWKEARRGKKYILVHGKDEPVLGNTWTRIAEKTELQMDQCDFTNARLVDILFYRVSMGQSIFAKTQMDSIRIYTCNMSGCIMEEANLRQGRIYAVDFRSAALADAILYRSRCRLVNFEDSDLKRLHAPAARFHLCSFERSDCGRIDLTRARLTDCSFRDALLGEAELTKAFFADVSFENCIAEGMLSSYSMFKRCVFRNSFLGKSSFNFSEFHSCCFGYASFADSTVSGAVFDGCDFTETNFSNTCFIGVTFRDSKNLEVDSFGGARFINPVFEGTDAFFEKILLKNGIVVRTAQESDLCGSN